MKCHLNSCVQRRDRIAKRLIREVLAAELPNRPRAADYATKGIS